MKKTNAVRLLESGNIDFQIFEYEYSEEELDAVSVARKIDANPEQVFKTLVCTNGNEYFTFIIPGNYELDLKKAAKSSGSKKIELIKLKELHPLTGYIHGGCSPIGMKKQFPTSIDESAQLFDKIYVSAGVRGMQIFINPADLKRIIGAKFVDLI